MFGKKTWTLANEIITKEDFCEAMSAIEAMLCCVQDSIELAEQNPTLVDTPAGHELLAQADVISTCIAPFVFLLKHGVGIRNAADPRIAMINDFICGSEGGENEIVSDEHDKLYDVLTKPMH